ncbi:hypothetical protein AU461_23215 [Vibrio parahaemolyticus]|nr:hypothetical protein AU461_23215 [Vibrio parahaemolyticus]KYX47752.1 hypothetical protein AU389_02115 [Vibrio parahaemolyticus]
MRFQNVIFGDWVIEKFGPRGTSKAARFLGYPSKTVASWMRLERFPRVRGQEVISLKSCGAVDVNEWRRAYLAAQQKERVTP